MIKWFLLGYVGVAIGHYLITSEKNVVKSLIWPVTIAQNQMLSNRSTLGYIDETL